MLNSYLFYVTINPLKSSVGPSPRGKAQDFDSCIRWFKSNWPSKPGSFYPKGSGIFISIKKSRKVPGDNTFTGWVQGLEPWASRATIWRASQLRYTHHKLKRDLKKDP